MISSCRSLSLTTIRPSRKVIPSFCFQLALSLGLIGTCFLNFIFVTIWSPVVLMFIDPICSAEIRVTFVLSFSVATRWSGHLESALGFPIVFPAWCLRI
jgi:hypothetical protein